jgi:hypothetical protein
MWASLGLTQAAYVGVKHGSTRFFLAQRRMVSPLCADRLSKTT